MNATHDDNATTWRNLADQLTPEQMRRLERQEATASASIAAGHNPFESARHCARPPERGALGG